MEAFVDDHNAVLKPGDAIYYDSTSIHLVRAYGDKPARILAIIMS
jgi:mannose-6-phosphate isomerase-like protein (cupin superfamily)